MVSRLPDAYWIRPVVLRHGLNRAGRIANGITFGLAGTVWRLAHWKEYTGNYYLVELGEQQCLVRVDETSLTSAPLPSRVRNADEFWFDGRKYLKTGYDLIKG